VEAGGQCLYLNVVCTGVAGDMMTCPGQGSGYRCCLPGGADCGQPDAATVTCPEAATPHPGATQCTGFPTVLVPAGSPNGVPGVAKEVPFTPPGGFEPDAAFAFGCYVTFPFCSGDSLYVCGCSGEWSCSTE